MAVIFALCFQRAVGGSATKLPQVSDLEALGLVQHHPEDQTLVVVVVVVSPFRMHSI
jgi:hypothetical protein